MAFFARVNRVFSSNIQDILMTTCLWVCFQTVEKGAERRKVIAKRDKKQTLPIK